MEPVLRNYPIYLRNVITQDRWSLVTGSHVLKCGLSYKNV